MMEDTPLFGGHLVNDENKNKGILQDGRRFHINIFLLYKDFFNQKKTLGT